MNIRGINLEFRVVADNVGGAKASSTAKASVSKLGSAPVVLVNPDIMTVGIKNGMEFSFDKENWILVPEYSKKFGAENYLVTEAERKDAIETIYTKERLAALMMQEIFKTKIAGFKTNTAMNRANLEAILGNNVTFEDKGVVLYVREISTDRKAASKISEVYIPYAPEDTANANPDDIKFSYGDSKTNSGGIVIENKSKYKYQVGVIAPDSTEYSKIGTAEEDDLDLSGIKWTSVKGGKMMKISNKKVPKGSYLVYRIAGEDGNLPSTYKIYGPMKYDHVTYAGIGTATYAAGQTLTAVPSTNFKGDEKGNYRDEYNKNLSIQWQGSLDKLAKDEYWKNLSTNTSLELTNDMKDMYIRVIISDVHGNKKYSDPVGPVKYVEPPKDDNKGDQNATPTPDGKQ